MLITPNFQPVPPQDAVKRLKAIDRHLDMQWVPSAAGPYWGIIERWREDDPRWSRVRCGEMPSSAAFDVRAMLPHDCSPHEADSFVMREFTPVRDAAKEATQKVARVQKFNREKKEQHIEKFLEEQEHKTARTTKHDYEVQLGLATAHPMVAGVGEGSGKKKRTAE